MSQCGDKPIVTRPVKNGREEISSGKTETSTSPKQKFGSSVKRSAPHDRFQTTNGPEQLFRVA
jgi:hypothetical protein